MPDLTGTPTSLGIGTYNVDVDAPSGLGFNTAMGQINTIIGGRVASPASIATGEVPVWNGTAWVRSGDAVGTGINISSLHGFPNDNTKILLGDGTWGAPATSSYLRKTTAKAVTNTVTETDLLNGEFTLPANTLGTNRLARLTAWGDAAYGAAQAVPRIKFKYGATPTVVIDTSTPATNVFGSSGATRCNWRIEVEMMALGATNAQNVMFDAWFTQTGATPTAGTIAFATGQGVVSTPTANSTGTIVWARGGNTAAMDDTSSQAIILTTINGSATSTDVTLKGALLEIV